MCVNDMVWSSCLTLSRDYFNTAIRKYVLIVFITAISIRISYISSMIPFKKLLKVTFSPLLITNPRSNI